MCLSVCVCVSQSPAKDMSIFNEKQTFAVMWKRVRVKVSLLFLLCEKILFASLDVGVMQVYLSLVH